MKKNAYERGVDAALVCLGLAKKADVTPGTWAPVAASILGTPLAGPPLAAAAGGLAAPEGKAGGGATGALLGSTIGGATGILPGALIAALLTRGESARAALLGGLAGGGVGAGLGAGLGYNFGTD